MFQKIKNYYNNRKIYNRTVNELYGLSNKDLSDIGISRSDIYRIARESLRK
jgi:uncharacterized protein YjiS (DUF1127 family)